MKDFKDLLVWQKSYELAVLIYRLTQMFPKHEIYGLTSQIRRAAGSIGANIAEGCGDPMGNWGDLFKSQEDHQSELEHHLLIAKALNFLKPVDCENLLRKVTEVQRMLTAFSKTVHSGLQTSKAKAAGSTSS